MCVACDSSGKQQPVCKCITNRETMTKLHLFLALMLKAGTHYRIHVYGPYVRPVCTGAKSVIWTPVYTGRAGDQIPG